MSTSNKAIAHILTNVSYKIHHFNQLPDAQSVYVDIATSSAEPVVLVMRRVDQRLCENQLSCEPKQKQIQRETRVMLSHSLSSFISGRSTVSDRLIHLSFV